MAKKDDAADTAVEQTEKGELFGHLTDADKATVGFTDEELAEMEGDEAEGEEADGTEEAETKAEAEETEEAEAPADGEEAEGEDEEAAEEGEEAEAPAEGEKPTEEAAATEDDVSDDDPAVQSLLDTRSVLPSEWSLGEGGVTKAQETLAGLDTKATELATKFDQGDITAADYRAQADQIETQRQMLRGDIRDAERAFQRAQGHWEQKSVAKFLRDNPDWKASATRLQMLDGEVRRLQAESGDPFDPRHLVRAANNLNKAMGLTAKAETAEAKAAPKKGNPVPKGKRPDIPPTLARVPNDEINDVDGGKYARLDRLANQNPTAYEEALGKMSEAEREAYMAA
jgi:hypothetical protein